MTETAVVIVPDVVDSAVVIVGNELAPIDIWLTEEPVSIFGVGTVGPAGPPGPTGPPGVGEVESVNGQQGVVVLDAGDVGADPAGTAAALIDAMPPLDVEDDVRDPADVMTVSTHDGVTWINVTNLALLSDIVGADLSGAIILAPATSGRNVIEPTADATALTLKAFAGQGQDTPILLLLREGGENLLRAMQDPSGDSLVFGDDTSGTDQQWGVDVVPGEWAQSTVQVRVAALTAFRIDSYFDELDAANSYSRFTIQMQTGQTVPAIVLKADSGDTLFSVTETGAVISNAQTLPDVADLNIGDHGSVSDPTAAAPTVTWFLKDTLGALRTATVPMT